MLFFFSLGGRGGFMKLVMLTVNYFDLLNGYYHLKNQT